MSDQERWAEYEAEGLAMHTPEFERQRDAELDAAIVVKYADLKSEHAKLRAAIVEFVDAESWAFEQHAVNPNDREPWERVAVAKAALRRLVGRELREEATK